MPDKSAELLASEKTADLLRKLIIIQLGLAGVGQIQIRQIAGGGMGEINGIVKLLHQKKRKGKANG